MLAAVLQYALEELQLPRSALEKHAYQPDNWPLSGSGPSRQPRSPCLLGCTESSENQDMQPAQEGIGFHEQQLSKALAQRDWNSTLGSKDALLGWKDRSVDLAQRPLVPSHQLRQQPPGEGRSIIRSIARQPPPAIIAHETVSSTDALTDASQEHLPVSSSSRRQLDARVIQAMASAVAPEPGEFPQENGHDGEAEAAMLLGSLTSKERGCSSSGQTHAPGSSPLSQGVSWADSQEQEHYTASLDEEGEQSLSNGLASQSGEAILARLGWGKRLHTEPPLQRGELVMDSRRIDVTRLRAEQRLWVQMKRARPHCLLLFSRGDSYQVVLWPQLGWFALPFVKQHSYVCPVPAEYFGKAYLHSLISSYAGAVVF